MPDDVFYCPGCGLPGGDGRLAADSKCNTSDYCWKLYQELTVYTFSLGDADFIHQHAIDAYTAQHSGSRLRGIQICFALVGLYLFVEQDYSGRAVQQVHRRLAEQTKDWPHLRHEGLIAGFTVQNVLLLSSPEERADAIRRWAAVIWQAWQAERPKIVEICIRGSFGI